MPDSSLYQKRKDQNADIQLHRHLLHDCRNIPVIVRTRTAMQMGQYLRCDPFLRLARSDSSGLHPICRPRRNRKNIKKDYKYFLGAVAIFVGLTVIAQLINVTLHYTGGINYKPTDGKPFKDVKNTPLFDPDVASCFYISPFFVSNMPVYSKIWLKFGWFANYIIYVISFSFLATIVYFLNSLIKYCMIKYAAWRIKKK